MRDRLALLLFILTIAVYVKSMVTVTETVPNDVHPYIKQLHIKSDIRYRFSTTVVESKMVNPDSVAREVIFDVTLPNEAFMTNFTLEIDGKIYVGEVKEKAAAKRQFEKAKALGQSAGHISAKPRETNKFNIEVNLAAKGIVNFVLTYQELLRRKLGLYEHVTYINPGQLVPDFKVEVAMQESRAISTLEVPQLKNDLLTESKPVDKGPQGLTVIHDQTSKSAYILYKPTLQQQKLVSENGVAGQFVVKYGVNREENAGEILLVNGYFVHYFAVDSAFTMPKDVLFVLDTSGSMSGRKIIQLRDAMLNILSDVQPKDKFNIMTFSSDIKYWKPDTLEDATTLSINEAKSYIRTLIAMGGTNINKAVTEGIKMLREKTVKGRAPVLIFLTDGQPTVGVTNTNTILTNIERYNEGTVPIFGLAFGRGADYTFVRKLAAQNNGIGRKIYEDSDANLQIEGFYDEIATVLLKNVTFHYLKGTIDEASLTKVHFNTFFKGTELILAGKVAYGCVASLGLTVQGEGAKGKVSFTSPSEIVPNFNMNLTGNKDIGEITEKLWAYLTIKQLLKEREAATDKAKQEMLKEKILEMSLKYNFVTPLTSMVVTLPDSNKQLEDFLEKPRTSSSSTRINNQPPPSGRGLGQTVPTRTRLPQTFAGTTSGLKHPTTPTHTAAAPTTTATTTTTTTTTTVMDKTTTNDITTTGQINKVSARSIMVKVAGLPNDALCLDFELKPGITYTLLIHPDITVEATGGPSAGLISKIMAKTKGHTLVFLPNQYTIDGTLQQYTANIFELDKYNKMLPFKIGVVSLSNSLVFYMEIPANAYGLGGLLAPYENVKVESISTRKKGISHFASIVLKRNGLISTYYSNSNVRGIQQPSNPLNSVICWSLKNIDIKFKPVP